jgi:hypothetical protein
MSSRLALPQLQSTLLTCRHHMPQWQLHQHPPTSPWTPTASKPPSTDSCLLFHCFGPSPPPISSGFAVGHSDYFCASLATVIHQSSRGNPDVAEMLLLALSPCASMTHEETLLVRFQLGQLFQKNPTVPILRQPTLALPPPLAATLPPQPPVRHQQLVFPPPCLTRPALPPKPLSTGQAQSGGNCCSRWRQN